MNYKKVALDYEDYDRGASHILLVLIIMFVLSLVGISLQLFVSMQTKSSKTTSRVQESFFSAEGVFYDTIRYRTATGSWPASSVVKVGNTTVTRSWVDKGDGKYTIYVEADTRGVKRKVEGSYTQHSDEGSILDVVLLFDMSDSMDDGSPITLRESAKQAGLQFLDIIEASSDLHRTALVYYNQAAILKSGLTFNEDEIRTHLNQIDENTTELGTDIIIGLKKADEVLRNTAPISPDAERVIVLMTDGIPTWADPAHCDGKLNVSCYGFPGDRKCYCSTSGCVVPGSGQAPDGYGTCCTNSTILTSNGLKSDYRVISVVFYQDDASTCDKDTMGKATMLRISSEIPVDVPLEDDRKYENFFDTNVISDLTAIYQNIAKVLTVKPSYSLREIEAN